MSIRCRRDRLPVACAGFAAVATSLLFSSGAVAVSTCPPSTIPDVATPAPAQTADAKELARELWPTSGYRLAISAIDLDQPVVVRGGAAALDAGFVVNLTGCWPVSSCTVYLAGHNTSHGGVFNRVDNLRVGDEVFLLTNTTAYTYSIDSKQLVCRHTTTLGDVAVGDLVLQTSHGNDEVWIVHGTRT